MNLEGEPDVSVPARAIGEPHRALILSALLRGDQLSAGELARLAGVTPATVSEHLRLLQEAGLISVAQQGRRRYFSLANRDVARAIEALQSLAPVRPVRSLRRSRIARGLHEGRSCYDHLAGELGLRLTGIMQRAGIVPALEPGAVVPMPQPLPVCEVSAALKLNLQPPAQSRRPWARGCLDWTHRQPHLAGYLGAEVMSALNRQGWIRRASDSRAVALTPAGLEGLDRLAALTDTI